MQATAELQIIPLGRGVSVRNEVRRAVDLLRESGLTVETHASGTNLEGELQTVLKYVARIHEDLHAAGTVRLVSYLKLETRTDKSISLAAKKL